MRATDFFHKQVLYPGSLQTVHMLVPSFSICPTRFTQPMPVCLPQVHVILIWAASVSSYCCVSATWGKEYGLWTRQTWTCALVILIARGPKHLNAQLNVFEPQFPHGNWEQSKSWFLWGFSESENMSVKCLSKWLVYCRFSIMCSYSEST